MTDTQIIKYGIKRIGCDVARLTRTTCTPMIWFIAGYKRNTRQDPGQWVKSVPGKPDKKIHFDYTQEKVVASGRTIEALRNSIDRYAELLKEEQRRDV